MNKQPEAFDTDYTDEVTCPWCGSQHEDSWYISPNAESGEFDCEDCGKTMLFIRHLTISYSTRRPEASNG